MKYVYSGMYTQFMGRVFFNGNAVDITDRATLEAIQKRPDFRRLEDEKKDQAPTEKVLKVLIVLMPDECPKCGKVVKRGKFMHQKFCRGK